MNFIQTIQSIINSEHSEEEKKTMILSEVKRVNKELSK